MLGKLVKQLGTLGDDNAGSVSDLLAKITSKNRRVREPALEEFKRFLRGDPCWEPPLRAVSALRVSSEPIPFPLETAFEEGRLYHGFPLVVDRHFKSVFCSPECLSAVPDAEYATELIRYLFVLRGGGDDVKIRESFERMRLPYVLSVRHVYWILAQKETADMIRSARFGTFLLVKARVDCLYEVSMRFYEEAWRLYCLPVSEDRRFPGWCPGNFVYGPYAEPDMSEFD